MHIVCFNSTWKANLPFHALQHSHLIHADAYSSNSAASAFRFCLPSCFASNSSLSFLHSSTRFSYSCLLPNMFNDSSRIPSRESCVSFSFCRPIKCAFSGSQSATKHYARFGVSIAYSRQEIWVNESGLWSRSRVLLPDCGLRLKILYKTGTNKIDTCVPYTTPSVPSSSDRLTSARLSRTCRR